MSSENSCPEFYHLPKSKKSKDLCLGLPSASFFIVLLVVVVLRSRFPAPPADQNLRSEAEAGWRFALASFYYLPGN
jgi:hypothetical protein